MNLSLKLSSQLSSKLSSVSTLSVLGKTQVNVSLQAISGNVDFYTKLHVPMHRLSIEHVVPQSRLHENLTWDLHNIRMIDQDLNKFRADTRFGPQTMKHLSYCPPRNKGKVARICAHMFNTCTCMGYDLDHKLIIDYNLMYHWDMLYPVTDEERYMNDHIYAVQGVSNEYVDGTKTL